MIRLKTFSQTDIGILSGGCFNYVQTLQLEVSPEDYYLGPDEKWHSTNATEPGAYPVLHDGGKYSLQAPILPIGDCSTLPQIDGLLPDNLEIWVCGREMAALLRSC